MTEHPAELPDRSQRPRESAPEWVRDEILKWIEQGTYKPADPLPSERELQIMFGVSRVVVREAIVRLQAIGLVKVEHGRGSSVNATLPDLMRGPFRVWLDLNRDEVVNLLKLRRALDGLAAEEAAAADEGPIEVIVEREQAFAAAVASDADPVRLVTLDKELHVAIANAGGVRIVAQLLGDLDANSANIHRTSMAMPGRPAASVRDHRAIVTAIKDRNATRARRAAERHVEGTIAQVQAVLAEQTNTSAVPS
ncbi:FadR/GntR family transcriptional regulator [Nakamurella lactea]|uniref:FadR/GntR family transcriptional regulator n=1 Tax=Nakamurella lactea TaxID=459515 RepID=UPI000406224D|nr:GntR family transcriptional regulator [Nakamurella lactea]